MADKYGPIFTINLGQHKALIVSSWEMAKQCFTTNDKVFATRPKHLAGKLLGYNYSMFGFSPYGPYWRHVRKIATVELLSNHRLELLRHVRESEVNACTKDLYDKWERNGGESDWVLVEMNRWFADVTLNIMYRVVVGKRFLGAATVEEKEENERCRKALRDFLRLSSEFVVSDKIPFLKWLDFGGIGKAMKATAKDLDVALQGWLEEHKQKRNSRSELNSGNVKDERDFMDTMLSVLGDVSAEGFPSTTIADTTIKATCLAAILGGTDPTTAVLTWVLSLLLNNREALKKAQEELDNQVGRERQVKESDVKNLVYLQAIVKETLRLYPPSPLSIPHECIEDCNVGNGTNYHVKTGTRLLVNIWKIHRNPNVWLDPFRFQPERFLTTHKDFDVRGQNFEFIPFGSGRRMCPGVSLGLQVVQLTLAQLLHGFEIATPSDEPVDMTESTGVTNMKATPLEVLLTPRLPAKLYEIN
ncbi:cytochrome P450 CYP82D47 [Pyrus x bretschneideri]|uniref:cytochrome P450 CYP82D47 n=1 Tax=Pyrus x bretschneideri TaxID=225117 RepID=UPI00202EF14B|nr:cytochrome P450 CYP82D47 [Pyrus x bretschneideri]